MPIATLTRSLTVVMLAAAVTISLAHEHEKGGPAASLRGEVLDLACFVSHGSRGADHVACAKKCVMGGQPMGLLTDSGAVWPSSRRTSSSMRRTALISAGSVIIGSSTRH